MSQSVIIMMLAHFSHYLHNNQAPSGHEAREVKALRANPLKEISTMDVEIERFERILDSLKRKRADFQKSVDDCNTILAPVRRLPMDVLGVIFTFCLATHRNPVMGASEAPILLTQICRDWRSIALSIPRLWSRLYIPRLQKVLQYPGEVLPAIRDGEHRMEALSEEVQRWLRLSGACPLSITMMRTSDRAVHQPLLEAIIQSSRRWQQLELEFLHPNSDISKKILSLSADDLCMLRELRLHSTDTSDTDEDLWHRSGLFTAPGLRSISIGYMHPRNVFPTGIPPNWKNLNHLFIHSPVFLGFAIKILNCCCNLIDCLLEIDNPWHSDASFNTSSTLSSFLSHLKFLSLQGDPVCCSRLFSKIEAPFLRILDCRGCFPHENEGSGLFNFLQSINALESFMINYHDFPGDKALKCYSLIPSLTHLVLGQSSTQRFSPFYASHEQVQLMSDLIHQCSPDSETTVLFPSLQVFEAYGIPSVTDALLLEFIMSRIDMTRSNTGVSNLRKVSVEFWRTRQTDIVPEALAYAQSAGIELELNLTYYAGDGFCESWSPSSGLSPDDTSWTYPLCDY